MNPLHIVSRRLYSLGVTCGLLPYRNLWPVPTEKWNDLYARGALAYYGGLREQGRLQVLIGHIKAFPRKPRVLDIGCGDGTFRTRIHDDEVADYLGLDISSTAIEAACARGLRNSRFRVDSLPSAGEGPFDIIALTDMIYYVEDLPALLEGLRPHLAADGRLLVLQYRHAGDVALRRTLARYFRLVDATEVISLGKPRLAWWIGSYASPSAET